MHSKYMSLDCPGVDGRYVSAAPAAAAGSIGKRNNCHVVPFEGFCNVSRIVVTITVRRHSACGSVFISHRK